MSLSEVVLVITLGFSPGSANHTSMNVLEYVQPNMASCQQEEKRVNEFKDQKFEYHSMCINRLKELNK